MSDTDSQVPLPDLNATAMPSEELAYNEDENTSRVAGDLEAVFDVPVQVSAVLGRSKMDVGELLKLVLVERLFSLTREKLMRIPAFARLYRSYREAIAWLKATEAWRLVSALARTGRENFKAMGARVAHRLQR